MTLGESGSSRGRLWLEEGWVTAPAASVTHISADAFLLPAAHSTKQVVADTLRHPTPLDVASSSTLKWQAVTTRSRNPADVTLDARFPPHICTDPPPLSDSLTAQSPKPCCRFQPVTWLSSGVGGDFHTKQSCHLRGTAAALVKSQLALLTFHCSGQSRGK